MSIISTIKQEAEKLLQDYQDFSNTLSPFNPFSRFSFSEKQPIFESRLYSIKRAFNEIADTFLSPEEKKQYDELRELISELEDRIL